MSNVRPVTLRYGNEQQQVNIPWKNFLDEVGMRQVEPAANPDAVIEAALNAPIGRPPLEELVRGTERLVVLVDDVTRPTPVYRLLPSILRRFEQASIPKDAICILVATGTHRPMTVSELEAKVGSETLAQYRVVNHDYSQPQALVHLGGTPSGIPITLNRLVAEADCVVAVGNIVPHRYCGWAGGAKIIQPGIGGEATTAATHLMITKDPDARLGVVENQVRHEMEAVAERANLKFIVNTILDRYANIVDVVAGDFRQAFRQGVERAREVYSVAITRQADIVLASAYPSDINYWQAGKALYSADLVVRDGGIIILASPCYEGVGEHEEFVQLLQYDYPTIERMIDNGDVKDRIGAAAALAVALVMGRALVWLVTSNIAADQIRRMKCTPFDTVQDAVDAALEIKGDKAQVTVLHEATEILPVVPL
jgi:nickel-dependent lactate racemase